MRGIFTFFGSFALLVQLLVGRAMANTTRNTKAMLSPETARVVTPELVRPRGGGRLKLSNVARNGVPRDGNISLFTHRNAPRGEAVAVSNTLPLSPALLLGFEPGETGSAERGPTRCPFPLHMGRQAVPSLHATVPA